MAEILQIAGVGRSNSHSVEGLLCLLFDLRYILAFR